MLNWTKENIKLLSVDLETFDPDIRELGAGVRRSGYIVGVAIGALFNDNTIQTKYFPLEHREGVNLEAIEAYPVIQELLALHCPKTGANLLYDFDYLKQYGFEINGQWLDVQIAEPLLDENQKSYSLQNISKRYGFEGKEETGINEWVAENLGKQADVKSNLWQIPAEIVAGYAEQDVRLPLLLLQQQLKKIKAQNLERVFELETKLQPMLLDMTRRGVRIDIIKRNTVEKALTERLEIAKQELKEISGMEINTFAAASIQAGAEKLGIFVDVPLTDNGAPSFTTTFLKYHSNPYYQKIYEVRQFDKMLQFVTAFKKFVTGGRIHSQFNQLRSDLFGTVSGRFSSSNPNLQQVPSRHEEFGPMMRSLFIPEIGCDWVKIDYSAIEPRIAVHYAIVGLRDSTAIHMAKQLYKDPGADVYQPLIDALPQFKRSTIKALWLGITYGMGKQTIARNLGVSVHEAEDIKRQFLSKAGFLKELSTVVTQKVNQTGELFTLMSRVRRFHSYEYRPTLEQIVEGDIVRTEPVSHAEAVKKYGRRIQRSQTYKALNSLIQGSSADIMKLAMLRLYESGVFEVTGVPHLTVHDELDFSIPRTFEGEQALEKIKHIMTTVIEKELKLKVPLHVSVDRGTNWGNVK